MASLLSLCVASVGANDVQHEYSITTVQRICYFLASVFLNASSPFGAVLCFTIILELIILLWNIDVKLIFLGLFCTLIVTLTLQRFLVWILRSLVFKLASISDNEDNVDKLPSDPSFGKFGNLPLFIFSQEMHRLPTSENIRTYFNRKFYISYNSMNSPALLSGFVNRCIFIIVWCIMLCGLKLIQLCVLNHFSHIFPTDISLARKTLLTICCFGTPLCWFLENLFLFLYFKYDEGFFTVANLQFKYNCDLALQDSDMTGLVKKTLSSVKKCVCEENSVKGEKNKKLDQKLMGHWIDLSWQIDNNSDSISSNSYHELDDSEVENALNLDESEHYLFEEIKMSIPYYRKNL